MGKVEGIKRGYLLVRHCFSSVPQHQLAHASSRGIFHRVIPFRGRKPHSPFYVVEISAGRGRLGAAKMMFLGHPDVWYLCARLSFLFPPDG